MFNFAPIEIPGCFHISVDKKQDKRGYFVKTYQRTAFEERMLDTDFREQYYSSSEEGCLRGMHFQIPPHEHSKLVYCISGTILDVVVDLRRRSPSFHKAESVILSGDDGSMLYIPAGIAHGFFVLSGPAVVVYNVTTEYAQSHDAGILWSSIPFQWPNASPIISARDMSFPAMDAFETPFSFTP